jgi:hypothetical protein
MSSSAWQHIDWGSFPDWIGGLGSALGVLVVYFGLRREIRHQRREQIAATAQQARLVSTRVTPQGEVVIEVDIENASPLPVFDLEVLPPPDTDKLTEGGRAARLNSTDHKRIYITLASRPEQDEVAAIDLIFTDHAGIRWHRHGGNQPQRWLAEPPRPAWRRPFSYRNTWAHTKR